MAAKASRAPKCNCNLGYVVVAIVLGSLSLWMLAAAFVAQFQGATAQMVLPWWLGGVVLMFLTKMSKWKSCESCNLHCKM